MPINIQFVRLDPDVCETLNHVARDQQRTVSELVNQIVRDHFARTTPDLSANGGATD